MVRCKEDMSAPVVDESTAAAAVDGRSSNTMTTVTDAVIIPAMIGVLAAAFSITVIVLVVVCRRRSCSHDSTQLYNDNNGYVSLQNTRRCGMSFKRGEYQRNSHSLCQSVLILR